ncbi:MAG: hypothetical protein JWN04_346 [Myxococcaceae bacterium]|nr:hypothetical protein [Myxococcaceae bacterium]
MTSERSGRRPKSKVRIGTSGWSYRHWRGDFYPSGLPAQRELEHISAEFSSLEINRSFYSLLTPASCQSWRAATPAGFEFSLKGSRFITHAKKLRDVAQSLANFFASGPLALADKLGPVIWQLPASLPFDAARIEAFFASLPRSQAAAALLAQQHDERVKHGAHLAVERDRPLRHAIEPRHESYRDSAFAELAVRYGVAIAVSDAADWPRFEVGTTDFMYVRLHGGTHTYASGYSEQELAAWAARIRAWQRGRYHDTPSRGARRVPSARDVYVYFDNDLHGHAPRDALALRALLP